MGPHPSRCQYCRSEHEIVVGRLRICADCGYNFRWSDRKLTHALKLAAGISPTLKKNAEWWRRIVLRGDPCAYCAEYGSDMRPDHIQPRNRRYGAGHEVWDNLTAACWRCNREKRDTPLIVYLAQRAARRSMREAA